MFINQIFLINKYNMGIKNLMQIIKRYSPNAIEYHKITDYQNKILGIDANLMIYKMIFAIRLNGYDLMNGDIIVTHIHSLLLKLKGLIKYNITPVFVFDGMHPKIKSQVIEQRKEFQNFMQQKYYQAITQDEKKKYYFMKSGITYEEIKECMDIIRMFGFTIVESPEEADSQLAELIKHDKINYVVTDDMDILVFGGSKLLKNFTVSDKKKIQEIDLDTIKKEIKMNQSQIIDLAILLGCDYCPSVKGVGTIGAYKLMQEYKDLETVMKNKPIALSYDYVEARKYFKNPPVIQAEKIKISKFDRSKVDKKGLKDFLDKHGYKEKYINELFNKF